MGRGRCLRPFPAAKPGALSRPCGVPGSAPQPSTSLSARTPASPAPLGPLRPGQLPPARPGTWDEVTGHLCAGWALRSWGGVSAGASAGQVRAPVRSRYPRRGERVRVGPSAGAGGAGKLRLPSGPRPPPPLSRCGVFGALAGAARAAAGGAGRRDGSPRVVHLVGIRSGRGWELSSSRGAGVLVLREPDGCFLRGKRQIAGPHWSRRDASVPEGEAPWCAALHDKSFQPGAQPT